MQKTFRIYHTNDIHSHFQHWSQIAAYLQDGKQRCRLQNKPFLQFDIGDHLDRFHPMTEGSAGRGNVRLLNEAGYDAITIGNNEGITLPKSQLEHLYDDANFPVLVANLFDDNGQRPRKMKPYELFSLENGVTVAAIGITTRFKAFYEPLGWQIRDPLDMLSDLIEEVRSQADVVVLLSHMGYFIDQQIARDFEGIDIILGGHTHHLLKQGRNVKGTTIIQAGKFGHYLGETEVTYDTETKQIVACEANCVLIEHYRSDIETESLLKELTLEGQAELQVPVAELQKPLSVSWFEESEFANLLAEALKEWCEADLGMANAGIVLESLPKGPVSKEDLHRICPHPINPCKLILTGSELREVARQSLTTEMKHLEIKGLGFRGKVLGVMAYSGLEMETKDGRVRSIRINGEPLQSKSEYEVATLDMYTFGKIFPGFTEKKKKYFLPEMLRDLLAWKLSRLQH
ncbi:MAG TPA: bifunctional UDP-sugar hydrolase/5'-nucleotidase [Bacillales bacterium]|nr:bifunctional UDP-sugar hydrolase/5'-nucleotidase [Bacillales bacterium]